MKKFNRLWGYLKPYWHLELLAFLVMALLAGLALVLPGSVQYLIDDLIPSLTEKPDASDNFRKVVYFGLFLVGIYLANVLFSWLRDYLAADIGANIIADMRSQLFRRLENLSMKFFQSHQVGEIMSRFLSDINQIQGLLTSTLLVFLTNILMLFAIVIYLLTINPLLTLIAIVPVPLTIVFSHIFGKKLHFIVKSLQETVAKLSARLQESLLSIKTIKAFGQEEAEKKKIDSILKKLTGLYVKTSTTSSLSVNLVHFINMLGPIIVLSWGTYLIAGGSMKLGALMAFYMLLTYFYSPIQDLASVNIQVQTAMASVNRIFEYLDYPPTVVESAVPVKLERARGIIEFRDVSFQYEKNGFKLERFKLKIGAKEKLAIVGPSGSGKTTLINLVMRFYDPDTGEIILDGINLKDLALSSLRSNIALVDQDPLLFRASIFDNITYAKSDATMDEVTAAAKIANIHDFIAALPEGYQSQVGERGVTLSGGEKQRICLARAIIKNPSVLILDEATSALDSRSEYLIQEALQNILVDKTAIIIAHRLATVQFADRIIVIDQGKIAEEGKHESLMQNSPLYRELASKQIRLLQ